MVRLDAADLARIETAVREAETRTAGEIVVVLAEQSASYRSVPLAATLLVSLLLPWPLLLLTDWTAALVFQAQLAAALAVLAVTQARTVRRALVPQAIRRRRAREAAERAFASCGLDRTRGRTGILLFVALAERHAEVIGDRAIAAALPEETWRGVIDGLVETSARTGIVSGITEAVAAIGTILAERLPPERVPADELPNRVVLL